MTTKDFIINAFNGRTRATACSSVFQDGNHNIYSYGYHYPLLFTIAGKAIRNVRGYSNTTARHISYTYNVDAISIHTLSGFRLTGSDSDIINSLAVGQRQYIAGLQSELDGKKRKDTAIYSDLSRRLAEAEQALYSLTGEHKEEPTKESALDTLIFN